MQAFDHVAPLGSGEPLDRQPRVQRELGPLPEREDVEQRRLRAGEQSAPLLKTGCPGFPGLRGHPVPQDVRITGGRSGVRTGRGDQHALRVLEHLGDSPHKVLTAGTRRHVLEHDHRRGVGPEPLPAGRPDLAGPVLALGQQRRTQPVVRNPDREQRPQHQVDRTGGPTADGQPSHRPSAVLAEEVRQLPCQRRLPAARRSVQHQHPAAALQGTPQAQRIGPQPRSRPVHRTPLRTTPGSPPLPAHDAAATATPMTSRECLPGTMPNRQACHPASRLTPRSSNSWYAPT